MKNIHILPTDKARLYIHQGKLYDNKKTMHIPDGTQIPQHIYIISDEEIKEGDYVCASGGFRFVKTLNNDKARTFKDNGIVSKQNPSSNCHLSNYKKIILTTDQDLIKDKVQSIDNEFLEWFVKNPSCEEVEVKFNNRGITGTEKILKTFGEYKIIISQEKQMAHNGLNGLTQKQTAVEWLEKELKKIPFVKVDDVLKEAKEMEKQQILDAYYISNDMEGRGTLIDAEQYYNETFKKK